MALTFLCPNGHRLSCADEQAGLAGQCPECGVRFRIPLPDQPDDGAAGSSESVADGDAEQGTGDEPAAQPVPERIVFLCPNGHRLFGPPHLAGRAGQCPHCGAKFRIPPLEEAPAGSDLFESTEDNSGSEEYAGDEIAGQVDESIAEQYEGTEQYDGAEQFESYEAAEEYDATAEPSVNGAAEYDEELAVEDVDLLGGNVAAEDDSTSGSIWPGAARGAAAIRRHGGDDFLGFGAAADAGEEDARPEQSFVSAADLPHPLAELCDRLWAETSSGAKIELVLADGNHLVVHHFARSWSQRSHGLFACREGDGTYTLTAVAWDTISRVIARGVPELADDLV